MSHAADEKATANPAHAANPANPENRLQSRAFEMTIEIDATLEDVWTAWPQAKELRRWFQRPAPMHSSSAA